jgi:hypothetical protein
MKIIVARHIDEAREYAGAIETPDAVLVDTSDPAGAGALPAKGKPEDVVLYSGFWLGEHWDAAREALEELVGVPYTDLRQA